MLFFLGLRYNQLHGFYLKNSQTDKLIFAESYLSKNFPLSINSAKIGIDNGCHYIELNGSLINNSGNYLKEIIISSNLELIYSTANGIENISFDSFKLTNLKTGQKYIFNKRIYYERQYLINEPRIEFMESVLRNKIDVATLSLYIDGTNSIGYKINDNIEMYPPIIELDVTNEWNKILNL